MTDGVSATTITLALDTNTDRALNDIKDAITRVRGHLPQNVNEPLIQRVDVVGLPIVTYAAIAPGKTPEQLSNFVDDVVKRALQDVRNVAHVERVGGVDREILVSLNPARLGGFGLTAADVSRRLRGNNLDLTGGRAELGDDQSIRTMAGAKHARRTCRNHDPACGGGEVRLDDLGLVTDTIAEPRGPSRASTASRSWRFSIKRSRGRAMSRSRLKCKNASTS